MKLSIFYKPAKRKVIILLNDSTVSASAIIFDRGSPLFFCSLLRISRIEYWIKFEISKGILLTAPNKLMLYVCTTCDGVKLKAHNIFFFSFRLFLFFTFFSLLFSLLLYIYFTDHFVSILATRDSISYIFSSTKTIFRFVQ